MTNVWKNMNTADLYGAMLSKNPEQAMRDLIKAKRALNLTANRARIKAGHKLMNAFHRRIMRLIEDFADYDDGMERLRAYPYIVEEFDDEEFIKLIRDYMEYCYD